MPQLIPVDHDPFAAPSETSPTMTPVDHDPFADVSAPKTPSFPQDEPGYAYGSILPFRVKQTPDGKDVPGSQELAWPEAVRSPVRGIMDMGERIKGPLTPGKMQGLNPDELAAFLTFGGMPRMTGGMFTNVAKETATTAASADRTALLGAAKRARTETKAGEIVSRRVSQDITEGGTTAQGIIDKLNRARELGKPAALVDVAGPNVKGLAGSVARKPGTSQAIIRDAMEGRDVGAADRLAGDVSRDLTSGPSAYRTTKALIETRQAEAQPLYDKAFEGGSIEPLEKQFQDAFADASAAVAKAAKDVASAQSQVTAAARRSQAGDDVYANSGANRGAREADQALISAQKAQAQATASKQQILEKLRSAQEDIANGTPGAVWNPRIQQFLDDPVMKRGMSRGMEIQRMEALAEGKVFDPTEFAVSPEGDVLKVPNMRVLDAGKKGLDAIIESEGRDEYGRLNQYGRAVNQVRLSLLKELDAVNPDYAAARASWSGHSASLDALKFGKNLTQLSPEQIAEEFSAMSPNDQEFVRLGAANSILERVGKVGIGGDEAKALIKNEWTKGQLKPIFKSKSDFDRFVEAVGIERGMFETKREILGGPQTATRVAEDEGNALSGSVHAAHGVAALAQGNLLSGARAALRAYRDLGIRQDPELNEAIARILTDMGVAPEAVGGKLSVRRPLPPLNVTRTQP